MNWVVEVQVSEETLKSGYYGNEAQAWEYYINRVRTELAHKSGDDGFHYYITYLWEGYRRDVYTIKARTMCFPFIIVELPKIFIEVEPNKVKQALCKIIALNSHLKLDEPKRAAFGFTMRVL